VSILTAITYTDELKMYNFRLVDYRKRKNEMALINVVNDARVLQAELSIFARSAANENLYL
jgi:hypothetical protein